METSIRLTGTISLSLLLLFGGQELPPPRPPSAEDPEETEAEFDTKR